MGYTEIARNIIKDGIRIVQVCNLPLNVSKIFPNIGLTRQKGYSRPIRTVNVPANAKRRFNGNPNLGGLPGSRRQDFGIHNRISKIRPLPLSCMTRDLRLELLWLLRSCQGLAYAD